MSLLGLAVLQEPVLLDLQDLLSTASLTESEKLYLGAAFASLGDYSTSNKIYSEYLEKTFLSSENNKNPYSLNSDSTAAALLLASLTGKDIPASFVEYLSTFSPQNQNQTYPYDLERLSYALFHKKTPEKALLQTEINGESKEIDLQKNPMYGITLSKSELQSATFTSDKDDVFATVRYQSVSPTITLSEDEKMSYSLSRSYTPVHGVNQVSNFTQVNLTITVPTPSEYTFYTISDVIPAGFRFSYGMQNDAKYFYSESDYATNSSYWYISNEKQNITVFFSCYPEKGSSSSNSSASTPPKTTTYTITYYINGTLSGTFSANIPFLLDVDGKIIAIGSKETSLNIKSIEE